MDVKKRWPIEGPIRRNFIDAKKNEGPIRIPMDSLTFLVNKLALLSNSSKYLEFLFALFTISAALLIRFRMNRVEVLRGARRRQ